MQVSLLLAYKVNGTSFTTMPPGAAAGLGIT